MKRKTIPGNADGLKGDILHERAGNDALNRPFGMAGTVF